MWECSSDNLVLGGRATAMPDPAEALLIYDKSYVPLILDRQKTLNCTV